MRHLSLVLTLVCEAETLVCVCVNLKTCFVVMLVAVYTEAI